MNSLRKDTKKAQQHRQLEKANADKYLKLVQEYKSQAVKADNEAKQQKAIVSKQQDLIKQLQDQLKNK